MHWTELFNETAKASIGDQEMVAWIFSRPMFMGRKKTKKRRKAMFAYLVLPPRSDKQSQRRRRVEIEAGRRKKKFRREKSRNRLCLPGKKSIKYMKSLDSIVGRSRALLL